MIASIVSDTSATVSVAFSNTASGLSFTQYYRDQVDTYTYLYSIDNFSVTTHATNFYERVIITNTSAVTSTYFRLKVALCPIVEAMPRSVDMNGNLKTAVNSFTDMYGFEIENTPQ